jgi:hypothetical protein
MLMNAFAAPIGRGARCSAEIHPSASAGETSPRKNTPLLYQVDSAAFDQPSKRLRQRVGLGSSATASAWDLRYGKLKGEPQGKGMLERIR